MLCYRYCVPYTQYGIRTKTPSSFKFLKEWPQINHLKGKFIGSLSSLAEQESVVYGAVEEMSR